MTHIRGRTKSYDFLKPYSKSGEKTAFDEPRTEISKKNLGNSKLELFTPKAEIAFDGTHTGRILFYPNLAVEEVQFNNGST